MRCSLQAGSCLSPISLCRDGYTTVTSVPAFPPLTVFCPFIYILTHKDFGGSNISNDFIAINLNYLVLKLSPIWPVGAPLN